MTSIHETMEALHHVGAIDNQTMRHFDDACLTPVRAMSPEGINAIPEREHVAISSSTKSASPPNKRSQSPHRPSPKF